MVRSCSQRIPDDEWERHKCTIKRLFLEEKKTLKGDSGLISIMERDYGFSASTAQFETKLKKWGYRKYATKADWDAIIQTDDDHQRQGRNTEIYLHDKLVGQKRIKKERSRRRACTRSRLSCPSLVQNVPSRMRVSLPPSERMSPRATISTSSMPATLHIEDVPPQEALVEKAVDQISSSLVRSPDWSLFVESDLSSADFTLDDRFQGLVNSMPDNLGISPSFGPLSLDMAMPTYSLEQPTMSFSYHPEVQIDSLNIESPNGIIPCQYQSQSSTMLHLFSLEKHIVPIARRTQRRLKTPFGQASFAMHVLHAPSTCQALSSRSTGLQFVYSFVFALVNNLVNLENLRSPKSPMDQLHVDIIQHFNGFALPQLAQMLDSVPSTLSRALEYSLFGVALEIGACQILEMLIDRGLNPNTIKIPIKNGSYTPLQRSCRHGWVDITRMLLERRPNARPATSLQLFLECLYTTGKSTSVSSNQLEIFTLLLKYRIIPHSCQHFLKRLSKFQDIRLYSACVENITSANYPLFIGSEFLTDIFHTNAPESTASIVEAILDRSWSKLTPSKAQGFRTKLKRVLCKAAFHNNAKAWKRLLKAGAETTPECLSSAIEGENIPVITYMLDIGASVLTASSPRDTIPLAAAIRSNSPQVLSLFYQRDLFSKLTNSYTCLVQSIIAACESGNEPILDELLRYWEQGVWNFPGCSFEKQSDISRAVSKAISCRHSNLVPKLLHAGICPENVSLPLALARREVGLARSLLEAISDIRASSIALHLAILAEDIPLIKDMADLGISLSESWERDPLIPTPFQIGGIYPVMTTALLQGNQDVIDLLLELGAPIEYPFESFIHDPSYDAIDPLRAAVHIKNSRMIKELLARGVNPLRSGAVRETVRSRDICTAKLLLSTIDNNHSQRSKKLSGEALVEAIHNEDVEMFELLVRYTDPNSLVSANGLDTMSEITALGAAIISNSDKSLHMMTVLLEQGAQVNGHIGCPKGRGSTSSSATPLIQAITTGQLAKVKILVERGARVDMPARMDVRQTPLQCAVDMGFVDIIEYLLQQGADVNEPPAVREGRTSLQLAAANGHIGIAYLLIGRGAIVNAPAGQLLGRTAFEAAAENGRIDMLTFLVENEIDLITDSGKQCQRAIKLAKANGQHAAAEIVENLYVEVRSIMEISLVSFQNDDFQM